MVCVVIVFPAGFAGVDAEVPAGAGSLVTQYTTVPKPTAISRTMPRRLMKVGFRGAAGGADEANGCGAGLAAATAIGAPQPRHAAAVDEIFRPHS